MLLLQLTPAFLSLLALAAHFLRGGNLIVAGLLVGTISLLMVPRAWAGRIVQLVLMLGTLVWLLTVYELTQVRAATGDPVGRMIAILGGVAAVCALSALLLRGQHARAWFRAGGEDRNETGDGDRSGA